jgi:hypothetical protein
MPSVIFGNVRSLRNKSDELEGLVKFQQDFKDCSLICLTETWLNDQDTNASVELSGFTIFRTDRTESSGKKCGGGVCAYVNDRWCRNITVKESYCDKDIEILTLALRPFYIPREFSNVVCAITYIPPDANMDCACEKLVDFMHVQEENYPDAAKVILGDFNRCKVNSHLTSFHQLVKCPTRDNAILDLFFCNVKDAYKVLTKPPLGNSDHILIHMIPKYRQTLKRFKPNEICIAQWSNECIDELQACFDCTDWNVLYDPSCSVDENVNVVTDYINFCVESIVPVKSVKIFPNNKPWVTKELKRLLNMKRSNDVINDKDKMAYVQKQIKSTIIK